MKTRSVVTLIGCVFVAPAHADIIHSDDVIIDNGSLCAGFDCVDGENFGFDTLRLKENNLRIHFDDTSNSASFPSNDWRIIINDSSNGGAAYFGIEDATAARRIFTLEALAPANSLYVDSSGRVGIGTPSPVTDIHTVSGNTPTLRLEQNGSSGFAPQTWDVAGNEVNFFIRDATNGSTLPFKIFPGAPNNAIAIASSGTLLSGNVGLGVNQPQEALHVGRSEGMILVEEPPGSAYGLRTQLQLENNGPPRVVFQNYASGLEWRLGMSVTPFDAIARPDTFAISRQGTGGPEFVIFKNGRVRIGPGANSVFELQPNGNVIISGTLTQGSSRDLKENFVEPDPQEILQRVKDLPISTWNYKSDDAAQRHLGPVAEDFHQAFALGTDEKHIAPSDAAGVALVAVQGLHELVREKEQLVTEQGRLISELQQKVDRLEGLVQTLLENEPPG